MAANMQHGGRSNKQRAVAPQLLIDLVTLLVYFGAGGGGSHFIQHIGVVHTPTSAQQGPLAVERQLWPASGSFAT